MNFKSIITTMFIDPDGNYAGHTATRDQHVLEVLDYGQYIPELVRKKFKAKKNKNRCLFTHLLIGTFGDYETDIIQGLTKTTDLKALKRELNSTQMREFADINRLMSIIGKHRNIYIRIYDQTTQLFSNEIVVIYEPTNIKSITLGFIQDHYVLLKQH